jgi:hypothetical protein
MPVAESEEDSPMLSAAGFDVAAGVAGRSVPDPVAEQPHDARALTPLLTF